MTKQHEIKFNLDGLEEIKKAVGNSFKTRVGVLGAKASRKGVKSGINNATLMMIHMFGSLKNNLPARDPLYIPIVKHRRELIKKIGTGEMREAFSSGNYKKMFTLLGVAAEEIVQNAFETAGDGSWKDISEETKARKHSSAILIDTQQMRRSVSSDVVNKSDVSSKTNPKSVSLT